MLVPVRPGRLVTLTWAQIIRDAARYYRQVLHNSLLGGATGWISWCNSDYDPLINQNPCRHHAFELHFGLTDSHGNAKPQLAEMKAFGDTLRAVDVGRCQRAPADTALVVSSYLDISYPFIAPEDPGYIHQTLRQAYVSARLADLPVALTRESDGIGGGARLYIAPSVKQLLAPSWLELERLAAGGATVYLSYSAGASEWQRGPSYGRLNAMFGVEHQLRAGLLDMIEDDTVTFTLQCGFAWLVSQADEPVTIKPELAAGLTLTPLDGIVGSECDRGAVTLAPFGVGVFGLEGILSSA